MQRLQPVLASVAKWLGLALVSAAILVPPALDLFGAEPPLEDFLSFHFAARGLRDHPGLDVWSIDELRRVAAEGGFRGRIYPYLYPPTLAWSWAPVSTADLLVAKRAWLVVSIVCASCACALVGAMAREPRRALGATVAASVVVLVAGWRGNLLAGQANALVALCIAAAGLAAVRGRDASAGAAIALAAALKITPAILILHFVARRRWRALGAFAAVLGAIALASILAGRASDWSAFLAAAPRMAHGETIEGLFPPEVGYNVAVAGVVARLVEGAGTIRIATYALLALLAAIPLSRSLRERDGLGGIAPLAALSCLLVLGSPFGYWHHALMLAPAVAWTWVWSQRSQAWTAPAATVLLGAVALELPAIFHALGADASSDLLIGTGTWLHLALFAVLAAWRPRARVLIG